MTDRVPDWLVERLAAGDLAPDVAASLRARLEARGENDRVDSLDGANRAFLEAHPVAPAVREIDRRLENSKRPPRRAWIVAVPLVLAAAAVSLWIAVRPTENRVPDDEIRLKGLEPHLVIYKKTGSGVERLANRDRVRAGDTVQVAYIAAGKPFGAIVSLDARGAVTHHLPEEGARAVELRAGETPLPHAFVLDDAPGFERFVFVTSATMFETSIIVDALRDDRPMPAGFVTMEIVLEKEP
jgi:hypothetical protein